MNRFVEWFCNTTTEALVDEINRYVKRYNLKIISISVTDNLYEAIVLFEGDSLNV